MKYIKSPLNYCDFVGNFRQKSHGAYGRISVKERYFNGVIVSLRLNVLGWVAPWEACVNLFDYLKNENFFKPFNLKYKKIYYDCMQLLIDKSKELPVLYESDARDCITFYLRNTLQILPEDLPQDTDEEAPGYPLQAGVMMNLVREAGWVLPREI